MNKQSFEFGGRDWTPEQYYRYGLALVRRAALWAESDKKLLERVKTNPLPPLIIDGKRWDEWEPTITNNLGQGTLP